jgi:2-methylcitrate dehydratase PrpD
LVQTSGFIQEMRMSIAVALADQIASVRFDALPAEAVHWSRVAIMDTVGCTLAGAIEPCARITARVSASSGPCLVFGTHQRVAPLDAALINGTAAHALDFDDCSNTLGGHPSAPILPALFALAETRAVSGRRRRLRCRLGDRDAHRTRSQLSSL